MVYLIAASPLIALGRKIRDKNKYIRSEALLFYLTSKSKHVSTSSILLREKQRNHLLKLSSKRVGVQVSARLSPTPSNELKTMAVVGDSHLRNKYIENIPLNFEMTDQKN